MIANRMRAALGKPSEQQVAQWYEDLLRKASANPGRVYVKRYGFGRAVSVVVPPQRKAGPGS